MTPDDFFEKYVQLLEKRLAANPDARGLPEMLQQVKAGGPLRLRQFAQPFLLTFPPVPQGCPSGSCTYQIDEDTFCLDNLTAEECDELGGTFAAAACPVQLTYKALTLGEFFEKYVRVLEMRLAANPAPDLSDKLQQVKDGGTANLRQFANPFLQTFPPFAVPVGSCTYLVGNQLFCLNNVTRAECALLAGTWSPGTCAVELIYQ